MKHFVKVLPVLGIALLLTSCGSSTSPESTGTGADSTVKKEVEVSPEQKQLSDNMVQASKDLSTSQVLGNVAFKSHEKLTVKYGEDAKNLTLTKDFNGKDGFVVLDRLKPDTEYTYEIYDGASRITLGTVRSQKANK